MAPADIHCPDCDGRDPTVVSHRRIPGVVHRRRYRCDDCGRTFRLFAPGWLLDALASLA
jgi:transposase-like protein